MNKNQYARATEWMRPVYWIDGEPWEATTGLLRPIGIPDFPPKCSISAIRKAVCDARVYGAQWTTDWNCTDSQWWYIVADDPNYDMDNFSKKVRYNIRLGLKSLEIRRLATSWLAEYGYPVYLAAFQRYVDYRSDSREEYFQKINGRKDIPAYQSWGAFDGETLVAYVTCLQIDDTIHCLTSKSHPEFFKKHPNEALNYVMTKTYLSDGEIRYVSRGSRVLHHQTNAQDFFEKLGYRKIMAISHLILRPDIDLLFKLGIGPVARAFDRINLVGGLARKIIALDDARMISIR